MNTEETISARRVAAWLKRLAGVLEHDCKWEPAALGYNHLTAEIAARIKHMATLGKNWHLCSRDTLAQELDEVRQLLDDARVLIEETHSHWTRTEQALTTCHELSDTRKALYTDASLRAASWCPIPSWRGLSFRAVIAQLLTARVFVPLAILAEWFRGRRAASKE